MKDNMNWNTRYANEIPYKLIYMTPREILKTHEVNEGELGDTLGHTNSTDPLKDFWNKKLKDAKESGLFDDIKKNGLVKPVTVIHYEGLHPGDNLPPREIFEGHHRLISSYHIAPDRPISVRVLSDNPYYLEGYDYQDHQF
jgi:hypothetical protein